jgi:hypothetical protein
VTARTSGHRRWLAVVTVVALAGWGAAPAVAGWRPSGLTPASIAYNQGITFDPARGEFFFTGVSSLATSGLYRTNSRLVQTLANVAVLPATREGYNHAGDLSFDPIGRRLLLPLECYYPASGGNTCRVGAIGVADPFSLRFLYYVNLNAAQIQKAMWAEVSSDGRWIWTSSGTHLLVYRAAEVNAAAAARQRAGKLGGISATDLGSVLPSAGVTGAAFYQDVFTRAPRLLLALNQGTYSEVISYATRSTRDGTPTVTGTPTSEITMPQSASDNESEGLAVTGAGVALNPLGGVLDWQMLPELRPTSFFTRILSYLPTPAPPPDGASMQPGQRLPTAIRGLKFRVICNRSCMSTATATIAGKLAGRLRLASANAENKPYPVGTGALSAGTGRRTLSIAFRRQARAALARLPSVRLTVVVRSTDTYSRNSATYRLSAPTHR